MKHLRVIPILSILLLVLACSSGPRATLPIQTPESFSAKSDHPLADRWWTAFGDAQVDTLVESALLSNFDLESAWHRLSGAQALLNRESAGFWPTLDAAADADADRGDGGDSETLRFSLSADYELDLWGRIRSGVDAERYRTRATLADYRTAALSLSAETVRTWFRLMEARNQLDLFDHQIDANEKALSLIRTRFGSGQVRTVDILRQRQLLESTREQKLATASRAAVLEHRLAVLLGRPPQSDIAYTHRPLPDLPPLPDTGLPAELIRRRPDVQQAHDLLLAADRDLASAVSNRYPRLTLSASTVTSSDDTDGLFGNWAHNFAAGLLGPIFDGGARGAEVDRNEARKRERLADYGQAVLTAFEEVENALVRERTQVARLESLDAQATLARRSYEQLRLEYLNGVADYLDVITALISEQRLQRDLISERLVLLEYRIALYRALAGGFETNRETG